MCKMLLLYLFGECRETDNWQPRNAVLTLAKRYTHQMQVARPVFFKLSRSAKTFCTKSLHHWVELAIFAVVNHKKQTPIETTLPQ